MGSSMVARNLFRTAGGTDAAFFAIRENMLQHDFLCFFGCHAEKHSKFWEAAELQAGIQARGRTMTFVSWASFLCFQAFFEAQ